MPLSFGFLEDEEETLEKVVPVSRYSNAVVFSVEETSSGSSCSGRATRQASGSPPGSGGPAPQVEIQRACQVGPNPTGRRRKQKGRLTHGTAQ
jgi:hypothetical protein